MNKIRSLTELRLYKEKLKYKELLLEKELVGNTADIVDHFSDKLKNLAFDLGKHIVGLLFKHKHNKKEQDE